MAIENDEKLNIKKLGERILRFWNTDTITKEIRKERLRCSNT